jgi:hypothetical protein
MRDRGSDVAELVEFVAHILGHGNVHIAFVVVPCQLDATVEASRPVGFDSVVLGEGVAEVVGIAIANVLDTKVVDDKGERGGLCRMLPESRGIHYFVLAMRFQVFAE